MIGQINFSPILSHLYISPLYRWLFFIQNNILLICIIILNLVIIIIEIGNYIFLPLISKLRRLQTLPLVDATFLSYIETPSSIPNKYIHFSFTSFPVSPSKTSEYRLSCFLYLLITSSLFSSLIKSVL